MKKPLLLHAQIIKSHTIDSLKAAGISESVAKFILTREGKECNSGDVGINYRYKIVGDCYDTDYVSVKTEGALKTLSMFRLTGGCNNLLAFEEDGIEKSEDYDNIPENKICYFSNDYEIAKKQLLTDYVGKTLRVVARTAEGTASFGSRYYLFTIED